MLIEDVIFVELEKRLDLCHHPGQGYIGFALIRVPATNILMYAREPILIYPRVTLETLDPGDGNTYLSQVGYVIARLRPHTRLQQDYVIADSPNEC